MNELKMYSIDINDYLGDHHWSPISLEHVEADTAFAIYESFYKSQGYVFNSNDFSSDDLFCCYKGINGNRREVQIEVVTVSKIPTIY
jgi:hypothetical protein